MRTKEELDRLRERAITLRREGKSRTEIQAILGLADRGTLNEFLRGVPPPDWTRRPNAKDDLRDKARHLRAEGLNYNQITARLGVSKSSVSLWVRDLPTPQGLSPQEVSERAAEASRQYWARERTAGAARRANERNTAAAEIGELSDREIIIAGAIAYWCEGSKSKPYARGDRVIFTNSDPGLILFFLRFLDAVGISRSDLSFCMQIHESADVAAAQRFWIEVTGRKDEQFVRPTLKRHNPKTTRKNVGDGYHGCLRIEVRRGTRLYSRIEGWATAVMAGSALSAKSASPVSW
jgi:transcriptional regulator with XRE-family HTH domain